MSVYVLWVHFKVVITRRINIEKNGKRIYKTTFKHGIYEGPGTQRNLTRASVTSLLANTPVSKKHPEAVQIQTRWFHSLNVKMACRQRILPTILKSEMLTNNSICDSSTRSSQLAFDAASPPTTCLCRQYGGRPVVNGMCRS